MVENLVSLNNETQEKAKKTIKSFNESLATLRTNRANVNALDGILVDYYDSKVPLNQVATINVPEPRTITLDVWDKAIIINIESAIRSSKLGINPIVDGTKIKLPFPNLTEETRKQIVKQAEELAEKSRIAIRQIRKQHMDNLKSLEKEKVITEDEAKTEAKHTEETIKQFIAEIDTILAKKSKEIMQI